jgi:hypothetical protein
LEKEKIALKTKFNKINADWVNVKNKCRTTINKAHTDNDVSSEFKTKLLISEHSPIRLIRFDWMWEKIESWCATHWVRHIWECFVSTRRSDKTGIDRSELSQTEEVIFEGEMNAQNAIDTMRKRLCFQSSPKTRGYAEDFKFILKQFEPEIADVLVPNCIYRLSCPEFEPCYFFKDFVKKNQNIDLLNIRERYKAYNDQFYKEKIH